MVLDSKTLVPIGLVILLLGFAAAWGVQHQTVQALCDEIACVRDETQRKDVADQRYGELTRMIEQVDEKVDRIADKVGASP